jgi:hypothetical protein
MQQQQKRLPDSLSKHIENTPPSKHGSREPRPPRVESTLSAHLLDWREKWLQEGCGISRNCVGCPVSRPAI